MEEPSPIHTVVWQVVAMREQDRRDVEEILRAVGRHVIREGILPIDAQLGIVRSAVTITRRESEVLEALFQQDHNREIATTLSISPRTVEFHVRHLMRRFGVHSRHRLLARAILAGVLPTSPTT